MAVSPVSEEWLRHLWEHQLLGNARLWTSDGRPVCILSPGRPNCDAGPDFTGAAIRIGGTTYHGDVEIHLDAAEWHAHHHGTDPHYNSVILHVVLNNRADVPPAQTVSRRILPLLLLHPYLDERLLALWTTSFLRNNPSTQRLLHCVGTNVNVPTQKLKTWLDRLAMERLEDRIRVLHERLKQLVDEEQSVLREPYPQYDGNGNDIATPSREYSRCDYVREGPWEQLLYEGIMEGMGYAKNRVPFRALAQNVRLAMLRRFDLQDTPTMMAILFGAAGLLPSSQKVRENEARRYLLALRHRWKELRPGLAIPLLHEADWLFFRLRPANFPTARLAVFCFLLPLLWRDGGFRRLVGLFNDSKEAMSRRIAALRSLFAVVPDTFWSRHVLFTGDCKSPGARLGPHRITDLLVNTVLPLVLLHGRTFNNEAALRNAHNVLAAIPPSQENSITLTIKQRLRGNLFLLDSACRQQGAIQLYKLYCTQARCTECPILQGVV